MEYMMKMTISQCGLTFPKIQLVLDRFRMKRMIQEFSNKLKCALHYMALRTLIILSSALKVKQALRCGELMTVLL